MVVDHELDSRGRDRVLRVEPELEREHLALLRKSASGERRDALSTVRTRRSGDASATRTSYTLSPSTSSESSHVSKSSAWRRAMPAVMGTGGEWVQVGPARVGRGGGAAHLWGILGRGCRSALCGACVPRRPTWSVCVCAFERQERETGMLARVGWRMLRPYGRAQQINLTCRYRGMRVTGQRYGAVCV